MVGKPAVAAESSSIISSVIPRGSTGWAYYRGAEAPAAGWQTSKRSWASGTAPFGVGSSTGQVNTLIPAVAGRQPLATYFTKSFTLTSDLPEWSWVNTWADDGIVIWINGVEIGRNNAPSGKITAGSYATAAPTSAAARKTPISFSVPAGVLKVGENTMAVQVLSNWRQTRNLSFDAHLVREDRTPSPAKPTPAPAPLPAPPVTSPAEPPVPPVDGTSIPGWGAPSWSDEFTYRDGSGKPAVDPAKWNVRGQDDLGLLFDAAVVDRKQVTVDNSGVLHIRADWLNTPVIRPSAQTGPRELWHKTGYLDQRRLGPDDVSMAQQYGRWEIRAKTPSGPNTFGSLAAFWLRNNQSGEIDIMEAWGYDDAAVRDQRIDTATTTVHTHTSNPALNQRYIWHHADYGAATPVWNDFHTYAFEFTPTYAAVIVDGVQLLRATPATHPNLWNPAYFGSPLHMRLNLHVGPSATYWGLPNPNNKAATQNLDFQVDYVRVWSYQG
ncbi:glycoside hydrolase family 16 protein [Microbacterium paraoxydans]|uniref:glycoside hydrolase family 16 protein n=1 Tax=Microbacterium paraoxydans TaxID=199592 RepID=UPI001CFA6255|nr:glycoside hydrolase family 16 protein [Microbacterium paraoxydans]